MEKKYTNNYKRKRSEEWVLSKELAKKNKRLVVINVTLSLLLLMSVFLLVYEKF